jgi:hypothetical protein
MSNDTLSLMIEDTVQIVCSILTFESLYNLKRGKQNGTIVIITFMDLIIHHFTQSQKQNHFFLNNSFSLTLSTNLSIKKG